MADTEINIKLNGIAQIRAELKALKGELANATDPEQMARLAEQAGVLSDRLKDANEKVAVFAAGSPFEQTNNALGLMGSQLMSLDFEGAAESSKLFASAAKGINGDVIAKSLKSLGTAVVQVGKAFMTVGLSLLTNPIFLIAAAIVGIVTVIGILLNKLGLLKPILNAIGQVFGFIGKIIDGVVQSIKDFLDWMGLTNFAAEEAAKKQVSALEKIDAKRQEGIGKISKEYDHKIRIAKLEGKNTTDLERQKQQAILATAQARYKDLLQMIANAKASGEYSDEEIKKMRESAKEAKATAQDARREIEAINVEEKNNNKKKNEEIEKQDKESYKKRVESAKQYAQERAAVARQIRDLEIALLGEGEVAEIVALNEKYLRIREDLAKNEKLTSDERKRLLELYAKEEEQARKAITEKYATKPEEQVSLLPPPEDLQSEADALVPIMKETFSSFDKLRFAFSENFQKSFDGTLGAADSTFKAMGALAEAFAGESEASAKKAFNIQKAANIAQATMDTYKGAVGAFTQAVSTYPAPLGQIIGGVQAAAVVAMGIANIKKISSQKFGDKGGNVSATGGGGGGTSTTAAQPNVQMFGQNNNANNLTSAQTMEQNGQNITVKAVVSETEITSTQNKIQKITQAASL